MMCRCNQARKWKHIRRCISGFTTAEMVVSSAIVGLIAIVLMTTFFTGAKQRQMGMERLSDIHEASQFILQLRRDVYGASAIVPDSDKKGFKLIVLGSDINYRFEEVSSERYYTTREAKPGEVERFGYGEGAGRFTEASVVAGPSDARFIWVDLTLKALSDMLGGDPLDFSTRIWGKSHQNRKGAWVDN